MESPISPPNSLTPTCSFIWAHRHTHSIALTNDATQYVQRRLCKLVNVVGAVTPGVAFVAPAGGEARGSDVLQRLRRREMVASAVKEGGARLMKVIVLHVECERAIEQTSKRVFYIWLLNWFL